VKTWLTGMELGMSGSEDTTIRFSSKKTNAGR
jgi:hypothetical protein